MLNIISLREKQIKTTMKYPKRQTNKTDYTLYKCW